MYGLSLALLLFLLKWLELRFLIFDHSFEIYAGFIAVLFTGLGIWLALKLSAKKVEKVIIERPVYLSAEDPFVPDSAKMEELSLSKREMEILGLMAQGLSNEEIAEKTFISLSTVKTHNQRLFGKLEVKRRTQAIEKAKRLRLIP